MTWIGIFASALLSLIFAAEPRTEPPCFSFVPEARLPRYSNWPERRTHLADLITVR